ncbi:hypothetical protein IE53DRAFT_383673 [Violaceomyces palustris]|uniref:Uncharacterized protein n=1 Tax=Violaceomyces palustris TaxID=1673888 RepID=A0ACD0P6P7_9BASI|nr:hypothetical protein IE53DRAFT_383673 [Violaceomyces palustris]
MKLSTSLFFTLVGLAGLSKSVVIPRHSSSSSSSSKPHLKVYELNVTYGRGAPDGYERDVFLLNGKWPADPILLDEGDEVEIRMNNQSPYPFAQHWHGIYQVGTPEMDGVPGVNQWNIPPGGNYTYRWKAIDQYGAYWHHSHERGYYADGLRGPIYIRPSKERARPWHLITKDPKEIQQLQEAEDDYSLLFFMDHYHNNTNQIMDIVEKSGVPPGCMDSFLLNGKGRQYCINQDQVAKFASPIEAHLHDAYSHIMKDYSTKGCVVLVEPKPGYDAKEVLDVEMTPCQNTTGAIEVFNAGKVVKAGRKWMNLQVIDASTGWFMGLSIDHHRMWIVAVDGQYVVPVQVDTAEVAIGSRLSVMVELNETYAHQRREFAVRLTGSAVLQPIEGYGLLSYDAKAPSERKLSLEEGFHHLLYEREGAAVDLGGDVLPGKVKLNESQLIPYEQPKVPGKADVTIHVLAAEMSLNAWSLAAQPLDTAKLADSAPMLFTEVEAMAKDQPHRSITNGSVVDLIVQSSPHTPDGGPNPTHPVHLHGHKFHVLGEGSDVFGWDDVESARAAGVKFNFENPPFRDGYNLPGGGWMVLRYTANNPGAQILHCHIDDHLIMGMGAVLLEGLDTLQPGQFGELLTKRPTLLPQTENDWFGNLTGAQLDEWRKANNWSEPTTTEGSWGSPRVHNDGSVTLGLERRSSSSSSHPRRSWSIREILNGHRSLESYRSSLSLA